MGGLFGGGNDNSTAQPVANGIRIQTSAYGLPVPIVYGLTRITGNLIWYGDFQAIANSQGAGGKGGMFATGQSTNTWTYRVAFCLGLCEGPIVDIYQVWAGKETIDLHPATITPGWQTVFGIYTGMVSEQGMVTFKGTYPQAPWSYLCSSHATQALPYPGLAYFAATNYDLKETPSLPNFTFVIAGLCPNYTTLATMNDEAATTPNITTKSEIGLIVPLSPPYTITVGHTADWAADISVAGGDGSDIPHTASEGVYTFEAIYAGSEVHITYGYVLLPFTVEVNEKATFVENIEVKWSTSGTILTEVVSDPTANEYAVDDGTYTFYKGDYNRAVLFDYIYGKIIGSNPATVFKDIWTNEYYGFNLSTSNILMSSLEDYNDYCIANEFFLSPAIIDQEDARDIFSRWLQATNSDIVWSEGKIKMMPYGDATATNGSVTWIPNITPIYDLDNDDFLGESESPILCSRNTPQDAYNHIQIEILNKNNEYNPEPVEFKDQANIEDFGLKTASVVKLHEITDPDLALRIAQIICAKHITVRNTYEFKLHWGYCLLEPGDLVTITEDGLGLNRQLVRIIEIEELDDNELKVIAEEVDIGVANPASYGHQSPGGGGYNQFIAPGNSTTPLILTPPLKLTTDPQVWLATSGGDNWGGCNIWVSDDDITYKKVGTLIGKSRFGSLSTVFGKGSALDTSNILSIDLTDSKGSLSSAATSEATNLRTLCYVDGEYLAYKNATLTTAYNYDLDYLIRGCYSSTIATHEMGSTFIRLDERLFKYDIDRKEIDRTMYVKLPAFNYYGRILQSLSDVTAHSYVVGNPGDEISRTPENLQISVNSATPGTKIDVSFDLCDLQDTVGSVYTAVAQGFTIDFATTGVNGLDTGSLATGTWYYFYAIANSVQGLVGGLGSTSSATPSLPSGYTHKYLLGAMRTFGSGGFKSFTQLGRDVYYGVIQTCSSGTVAQNWVDQDVSDLAPPVSLNAWFSLSVTTTTVTDFGVRKNGTTGSGSINGTAPVGTTQGEGWVSLDEDQIVELYIEEDSTWSLKVSAFRMSY